MSERGSFVTEYIYCKKCLEAAESVLLSRDKSLCSSTVANWDENDAFELPIIAGKIGASHEGGELLFFEHQLAPKLSKLLCHPLRVAVLAESGEQIFHLGPEEA